VGTVTVTDSGSSLTITDPSGFGFLEVGFIGTGTLNIESGGSVSADDVEIGLLLGSKGTVTITGSGSALTTTGSILVGGDFLGPGGSGILRVSDGGTVSVGALDELRIWETGVLTGGGGTIIGDVLSEGGIAPGNSFGTLTIDGALTLESTSLLSFDLDGFIQGIDYDFLNVLGPVTLGGDLDFSVISGSETIFTFEDTFEILKSIDPLSGSFIGLPNGTRLLANDHSGFFDVYYGPGSPFGANSVVLTGFVIPEPGTYELLMGLGMLVVVMVRCRRE